MKTRKLLILTCLISATLILWSLHGLGTLPDVVEIASHDGFAAIQAEASSSPHSLSGYRSIKMKGMDVSVVGVDALYFTLYPCRLRNGRFFYDVAGGMQSGIVINENLSTRLFGTMNPVGEYMEMDNKAYRVIGVVELRSTIGYPSEFIAFTLFEADDDYDYFVMSVEEDQSDAFVRSFQRVDDIRHDIALEKEIVWYQVSCFLAIFAIVILLQFMKRVPIMGKKLNLQYKRKLQEHYFFETGLLPLMVLKWAALICFSVGIAFILFSLLKVPLSQLSLFEEWIPRSLKFSAIIDRIDANYRNIWSRQRSITTPTAHAVQFYGQCIREGMWVMMLGMIIDKWNKWLCRRISCGIRKHFGVTDF